LRFYPILYSKENAFLPPPKLPCFSKCILYTS